LLIKGERGEEGKGVKNPAADENGKKMHQDMLRDFFF
jgi:hypothetical protein